MDLSGQNKRYDELAKKLLDGTITAEEKQEYLKWLNKEENGLLYIPPNFAGDRQELQERIFDALQQKMKSSQAEQLVVTSPEVPLNPPSYHRIWFKYAAAVIIVLGFAAYFWTSNRSNSSLATTNNNERLTNDALPGRDGAVLTLADGQKIILDHLGNGIVATQGKTTVLINNGQLVYNAAQYGGEILLNTIATPKGRQYKVVLPDGTKVWLNAESSITYPAAFVQDTRSIKVTGEAYFEVVKNKQKPFIVDVDGKAAVQVLGTRFNINSYQDENAIEATLIEGSVRVTRTNETRSDQSVILRPGQQAQINANAIAASSDPQLKVLNANIEEVLAWKNGFFQFNETSLESVLKQLERWYDIDVVFEGKIPDESFVGELPRNAPLSRILRVLEKTQVKFRIEGKRLIVTP